MARFCNQSKLDDQTRTWSNIKAAQMITARIDIIIGIKGDFSFSVVVTQLR